MNRPVQNRTRGSIWRKWDLHVHVPGTRKNNQYKSLKDGTPDWDQFIDIIHESDVDAIGITDYFSLESFFTFSEKYTQKYPDDKKVFFPNLELRLDHAVHHKGAEVNIHLLLPPNLSRDKANLLLANLELSNRDKSSNSGRHLKCSEIQDWGKDDLERASLSLDSIIKGITSTFPVTSENLEDAAVIVVSGRDDGASPGNFLSGIKEDAIDNIDISTHALFSRHKDSNYWLKEDRINRKQGSTPKPTFGGCDAHSFDDLKKMLGKSGNDYHRNWELTWVKADLSYDGLLQTLSEPEGRVRIQDSKPDSKESFRVIDRIEFLNTSDFPQTVQFNPNLTAIIGSRSSGKSALLAHVAYAVDKDYTVSQQAKANNKPADEKHQGPANSFTWQSVENLEREVVWADPNVKSGKIIYMPQNALFEMGDKAESVTDLLLPLLNETHPDAARILSEFDQSTRKQKTEIRSLVEDIFSAHNEIKQCDAQLQELGDKNAIETQIKHLHCQHADAIKQSGLSESEQQKLKQLGETLAKQTETVAKANKELDDWESVENYESHPFIATLTIQPELNRLPSELQDSLKSAITELQDAATLKLNSIAEEWKSSKEREKHKFESSIQSIRSENHALLKKADNAEAASRLEKEINSLKPILASIESVEKNKAQVKVRLDTSFANLQDHLKTHKNLITDVLNRFNSRNFSIAGGTAQVERGYPVESEPLIEKLNLRTLAEWADNDSDSKSLNFDRIHNDPQKFIDSFFSQKIKVKKGENEQDVIIEILTSLEDIRIFATYDDDRIGGFKPTSMTPGKRALFALTLLLDGREKKWPLLLDQPEDDLDSRSVFDTIVPFLKTVKTNRQIIMVTHDANLVVGADAEQVIVANRNGSDRPNANEDQLFDYFSGSIENTRDPEENDPRILERQGIREHCCEVLDGGREAFKKRKEKYKF